MKISVITVSYNSSETILDTLRSVASQTYSDIEHIIIDGGSTDSTLQLIEEHGESVTKLVSEPDFGIYDAMNKGLRLATGDLIGFLNGDDFFAHDNALHQIAMKIAPERVNSKNDDDTDGHLIYGDLVYVSRNPPYRVIRRWRSGTYHPSSLRFGWMPAHPTFYVSRKVADWAGDFDPSFRISGDYDFMLRCLKYPRARIEYLDEVVVNMRAGGLSNGSISSIFRKSKEDLSVIRRNNIGGILTLLCKNFRKLPQLAA